MSFDIREKSRRVEMRVSIVEQGLYSTRQNEPAYFTVRHDSNEKASYNSKLDSVRVCVRKHGQSHKVMRHRTVGSERP